MYTAKTLIHNLLYHYVKYYLPPKYDSNKMTHCRCFVTFLYFYNLQIILRTIDCSSDLRWLFLRLLQWQSNIEKTSLCLFSKINHLS